MSRALRDVTACREALARLPGLELSELRRQWRALYKADASPHLSRALLLRAVAYRMQEVALGGLCPERQRQLRADCAAVQRNRRDQATCSSRTAIGNPAGSGVAGPNL
jgi:hypothetical protein